MRPAELLDDLRGGPAELGHDVQPAALVVLRLVRVQRHARRARVGEDRDQLVRARVRVRVRLGQELTLTPTSTLTRTLTLTCPRRST